MGSRPGSSVLPGEYLPLDRGEEGIDTRELPPTEEGARGRTVVTPVNESQTLARQIARADAKPPPGLDDHLPRPGGL
jgi:hypothetical protein